MTHTYLYCSLDNQLKMLLPNEADVDTIERAEFLSPPPSVFYTIISKVSQPKASQMCVNPFIG